jgi:hypothetical protein
MTTSSNRTSSEQVLLLCPDGVGSAPSDISGTSSDVRNRRRDRTPPPDIRVQIKMRPGWGDVTSPHLRRDAISYGQSLSHDYRNVRVVIKGRWTGRTQFRTIALWRDGRRKR